jgi:hypothetical protein
MPGGGSCRYCLVVSHCNEVAIAVVCAGSRWDSAGAPVRRVVTRSDLRAPLLEGKRDGVLERKCAALPDRVVPSIGSVTCAGRREEPRVEPLLDGIPWVIVAMGGRGTDETRGAMVVAVDGGNGGEALQAFGLGPEDQLAAKLERLAESVSCGLRSAYEESGKSEISVLDHPDERAVELADDRARAVCEIHRVTIIAVVQRHPLRINEQKPQVVDVSDALKQRDGSFDPLAKLHGGGRPLRLCLARQGDLPVVGGGGRPVPRLVGKRVRDIGPRTVKVGRVKLERSGEK